MFPVPNKYLILGALVAAVGVAFMLKKGASVVADAAEAVNPFNNDNIINQGFTSLYQGVTGSTGTVGGDFYDATHGGRLDVTSSKNYAASSVDWLGGAISGQKDWSLGSAIYDWTH